jgi:hypothetical protein
MRHASIQTTMNVYGRAMTDRKRQAHSNVVQMWLLVTYGKDWLRGMDLNHRPLGYEPNELPDCSTPQFDSSARC